MLNNCSLLNKNCDENRDKTIQDTIFAINIISRPKHDLRIFHHFQY